MGTVEEGVRRDLDDSGCVQDEPSMMKSESGNRVQLLDLSDDVLLYILRHCSPRDLKALGFSCSRLASLVLERSLWRDVDARCEPCGRFRFKWLLQNALHSDTRRLMIAGFARQANGCLGQENGRRSGQWRGSEASEKLDEGGPSREGPDPAHPLPRRRIKCGAISHQLPRYSGALSWPDNPTDDRHEILAEDPYETPEGLCFGPRFTVDSRSLALLSRKCPALSILALEYCNLNCKTTSINHFPQTLTKLSLRGTKCYNVPMDKSFLYKIQDHLPNLEEVDVSECDWLEPCSLLPLSKLRELKRLKARGAVRLSEFVAYASLATRYGFRALEELDLRGCPVGDSEVSALGWLPALKVLRLQASSLRTTPLPTHRHGNVVPTSRDVLLDYWEVQEPDCLRSGPLTQTAPLDFSIKSDAEGNSSDNVNGGNLQNGGSDKTKSPLKRKPNNDDEAAGPKRKKPDDDDDDDDDTDKTKRIVSLGNKIKENNLEEFFKIKDDTQEGQNSKDGAGNGSKMEEKQGNIEESKALEQDFDESCDQIEDFGEFNIRGLTDDEMEDDNEPEMDQEVVVENRSMFRNRSDLVKYNKYNDNIESIGDYGDMEQKNGESSKNNENGGKIQEEIPGTSGESAKVNNDSKIRGYSKRRREGCVDDEIPGTSGQNTKTEKNTQEINSDSDKQGRIKRRKNDSDIDNIDKGCERGTSLDEMPGTSGQSAKGKQDDNSEGSGNKQEDNKVSDEPGPSKRKDDTKVDHFRKIYESSTTLELTGILGRCANRQRGSENTNNDSDMQAHSSKTNGNEGSENKSKAERWVRRVEGERDGENSENSKNPDDEGKKWGSNYIVTRYFGDNTRGESSKDDEGKNKPNEDDADANEERKRLHPEGVCISVIRKSGNLSLHVNARDGIRLTQERLRRMREERQNGEENQDEAGRFRGFICFRRGGNAEREVAALVDDPQYRALYFNFGQPHQVMYGYGHPMSFVTDRFGMAGGPLPDPSVLVSDMSIRRFGRAEGERISYVMVGPGGGNNEQLARPERSPLEVLSVQGYRHVTDRILTHLASAAPNLRRLDVRGTSVTEDGVERFKALRPDCEVISGALPPAVPEQP